MSPVPVALALPHKGHRLACVLVAAGPFVEEHILQQKAGRQGCPGSHRSPGLLGTAWQFGAISWVSLGFGVLNLVHVWVLPTGSAEVCGKNLPLCGTPA